MLGGAEQDLTGWATLIVFVDADSEEEATAWVQGQLGGLDDTRLASATVGTPPPGSFARVEPQR